MSKIIKVNVVHENFVGWTAIVTYKYGLFNHKIRTEKFEKWHQLMFRDRVSIFSEMEYQVEEFVDSMIHAGIKDWPQIEKK